ncbi:hypothetical protein EGW08_008031 [Elysia chlorotica]|uniref:Inward rectifier potassium channel C-terminal domain-containing protein n=1 Tax=Elysia chlorotica TaxID=188477 RepID=A0A3S1A6V3_ELYCH|nr:hypothetical protein EGW08_008031 [Elysia chlorotica]
MPEEDADRCSTSCSQIESSTTEGRETVFYTSQSGQPCVQVPDTTRRSSQDSFREYAQRHLSRPTTVLGPNGGGMGGGMGGLGSASANAARIRQRRNTAHFSKRMRRRLVYKNGEVNITQTNIRKRRRRYLADIFTTLVDIKWRYNLMLFALAFTLSWLIFALVWWLVCFSHGDLDVKNKNKEKFKPCVLEIHSFTSALLFSIETQHTIGYGSRHTTEECAEAIVLMMFQSCFGVICQALMTGIVFAKLSRPKKRAETLMFSKNACICKQDGDLCLLLRVGDMRKSQIVEAHIRAVLIKKKITKEGDVLPLYQFDVDLGFDEGRDRLFLVWPVIIVHKIDEESPFWELSPEDFLREQFELIVILEGIVESTGMTTQARSSYLPGEVLWGHRFERLVTFQKENGQYQIDFSRFHNTIPVDTPNCSAKELAEMTAAGQTPDQTFSGTCGVPAADEDDEEDDDDEDDDDLDEDDDDDDEENLSLGSKFERYHQLNRSQQHCQRRILKPASQPVRNGPYVAKRHGAAQTVAFGGVEDFESLPSKQSTSSDLRGSQEMSETLL